MRFALVACILLLPFAARSTCILIIRYHNKIIIVSDTKVSTRNIGDTSIEFANLSKVHKYGLIYVGIAGSQDVILDYYATHLLYNKIPNNSLIDRFSDSCNRTINENVKVLYQMNELSLLDVGKTFIEAGLAYYSSDSANLEILRYKIIRNLDHIAIGIHDHIESIFDKYYEALLTRNESMENIVRFMTSLIEMEIKNHPNEIGYPIEAITVSSTDTKKQRIRTN